MVARFSLIFALAILLTGCSKKDPISAGELNAFLADDENGLHLEKESGSLLLECTYHPADFILAQEIEGRKLSSAGIDSLEKGLRKYTYFLFKISKEGREIVDLLANDPQRFNKALDYLSFKIGNDFRLVNQTDTVRVEDFAYARSFGSANGSSVLLAFKFPLEGRSGKVSLLYDDTFFKTGLSHFDFQTGDMKSTPPLDYKPLIP